MRKGQEYSGIIDKTVFPTKGYTTVVDNNGDQQRVMIKGTIPGQKVDFRVSKKRSGKWEGRLLSIVEDSPFIKFIFVGLGLPLLYIRFIIVISF